MTVTVVPKNGPESDILLERVVINNEDDFQNIVALLRWHVDFAKAMGQPVPVVEIRKSSTKGVNHDRDRNGPYHEQ